MMMIRESRAEWKGSIKEGKGTVRFGSGAFDGAYSWRSRFEDGDGTNPEELIGAAHAGCFSMALSNLLTEANHIPEKIETTAKVHLGQQPKIELIELHTIATVPGINEEEFLALAEKAKGGCPVSQALAAVTIKLDAKLLT